MVVVLMYQLYNSSSNDAIKKLLPDFVPLAFAVLSSRPELRDDVPQHVKETHRDFVAAQVKTLSFIAYILNKSLLEPLQPYREQLPDNVLQVQVGGGSDSGGGPVRERRVSASMQLRSKGAGYLHSRLFVLVSPSWSFYM